jgi:hypothetical protein
VAGTLIVSAIRSNRYYVCHWKADWVKLIAVIAAVAF